MFSAALYLQIQLALETPPTAFLLVASSLHPNPTLTNPSPDASAHSPTLQRRSPPRTPSPPQIPPFLEFTPNNPPFLQESLLETVTAITDAKYDPHEWNFYERTLVLDEYIRILRTSKPQCTEAEDEFLEIYTNMAEDRFEIPECRDAECNFTHTIIAELKGRKVEAQLWKALVSEAEDSPLFKNHNWDMYQELYNTHPENPETRDFELMKWDRDMQPNQYDKKRKMQSKAQVIQQLAIQANVVRPREAAEDYENLRFVKNSYTNNPDREPMHQAFYGIDHSWAPIIIEDLSYAENDAQWKFPRTKACFSELRWQAWLQVCSRSGLDPAALTGIVVTEVTGTNGIAVVDNVRFTGGDHPAPPERPQRSGSESGSESESVGRNDEGDVRAELILVKPGSK